MKLIQWSFSLSFYSKCVSFPINSVFTVIPRSLFTLMLRAGQMVNLLWHEVNFILVKTGYGFQELLLSDGFQRQKESYLVCPGPILTVEVIETQAAQGPQSCETTSLMHYFFLPAPRPHHPGLHTPCNKQQS